MFSYNLENQYETPLRLVIEPEGLKYDLPSGGEVILKTSGGATPFSCSYFQDDEGFQKISFNLKKGTFEILDREKSVVGPIARKNSLNDSSVAADESFSYDLENNYKTPLRLILEPEAMEYDLPPGGKVTINTGGNIKTFLCVHFRDIEGFQSVSFWPETGTFEILYRGKDILEFPLGLLS